MVTWDQWDGDDFDGEHSRTVSQHVDVTSQVSLHVMYFFTCLNCGTINQVSMVDPCLSDDDAETCYRQANCLEEWQELPDGWRDDTQFRAAPDMVQCKACKLNFRLVDE